MPGGVWTDSDVNNPATRPGAYFNLVAQAVALVGEGVAGVVGIVARADWGPLDSFQELTSEAQVTAMFGDGLSLSKLSKQAIRGGAASVKVMRIAGTGSAPATASLDDSVPAAALTLTTLYHGARGNTFIAVVEDNPVAGVDLKLYEGTTLLEVFTTADGHNDAFVAAINGNSKYISAALAGAADRVVADNAGEAFGSGNSGATAAAGDYTAAQAIALQESFDVFVQDDEDDSAIQDALVEWAQDARLEGNRFITVLGSPAAQTLSAALTRADTMDNEGIVYVFPGFTDEDGTVYTGQEAAARVGGLIAGAGINRSITFSRIPDGADVGLRLTHSEISEGIAGGLLILVFDGESVRVEKGINTLTTITSEKPLSYSRIRTIAVLDAVQDGLNDGLTDLVGQVNNDEDGRATILGAAQAFLDELMAARALKPGAFVELDPEHVQDFDNVFLRVGLQPQDSIEKIFVTVYVSAA